MSAPVRAPWCPASESRLQSELTYQGRVNALLADRPRPAGQIGVLSHSELSRLDRCRAAGWSPERFADSVRAVDAARAGGAAK